MWGSFSSQEDCQQLYREFQTKLNSRY
uniref:Uncharacterized protein n=1 Tax=Arundo donax TaxID=35708 RepID=A0A0A9B5E1_ARUDO